MTHTDDETPTAADVDWPTVAGVAGKLGESISGLADTDVDAPTGTLARIAAALDDLQTVAAAAADRYGQAGASS